MLNRIEDDRGLIALINPKPIKSYRPKMLNHLEVRGMKINENVRKWLHIHHVNFNRKDNGIGNLRPMHRGNHLRLHKCKAS